MAHRFAVGASTEIRLIVLVGNSAAPSAVNVASAQAPGGPPVSAADTVFVTAPPPPTTPTAPITPTPGTALPGPSPTQTSPPGTTTPTPGTTTNPSGPPGPPPPSALGGLPNTGVAVLSMLTLAGLLVGAGLLLQAVSRRRYRPSHRND